MTSPITYPIDDRDLLDDAALWAAIDSAAAASLKRLNPYTSPPLTASGFRSLIDGEIVLPPPPSKLARSHSPMPILRHQRITTAATAKTPDPKVSSPTEVIRSHVSLSPRTSPMPIVRHHRTTTATSTDPKVSSPSTLCYSGVGGVEERESSNSMTHSLSGRFPSVSLFKEYQTAALAILEKSDYTLISGNPYIKKTGWRKISCYFNISYEIKDKTIEFDEDRNVHRAEFVVRAYMHGGRFSDGWGSCDRREKRFLKPNNDIPSTAETRAKNKACQDLLGIGGPGSSRAKY